MESDFKDVVAHHSDAELLTFVYQFDQWDAEFLLAVKNELSIRNILPEDIEYKKQRLIAKEDKQLSEGKEATFPQQFLGWIGVLGVLGLIIGYNLAFAKTTSIYTGKQYFKYDETSRESGKYMFYISLLIIALYVIYKIANNVDYYL